MTARGRGTSEARYVARPILNDQTIYAEPGAWDLLTGRKLPFALRRSYGCGIPAGSRNLLVFRSATLGFIDLTRGDTTENYGGIRPGCWVNAIPAGGLVLMADAASWCTCSYLNQATIALEPRPALLPVGISDGRAVNGRPKPPDCVVVMGPYRGLALGATGSASGCVCRQLGTGRASGTLGEPLRFPSGKPTSLLHCHIPQPLVRQRLAHAPRPSFSAGFSLASAVASG